MQGLDAIQQAACLAQALASCKFECFCEMPANNTEVSLQVHSRLIMTLSCRLLPSSTLFAHELEPAEVCDAQPGKAVDKVPMLQLPLMPCLSCCRSCVWHSASEQSRADRSEAEDNHEASTGGQGRHQEDCFHQLHGALQDHEQAA